MLEIVAPIPGTVVSVDVREGDVVRAGTPLVVLESMKMEQVVAAPAAGVVEKVHVEVGATVAPGDELLLITPGAAGTPADDEDLAAPVATIPKPQSPIPKKSGKYANAAPSWWVARAREGEVKPGFTKADILRPAKEEPRARAGYSSASARY